LPDYSDNEYTLSMRYYWQRQKENLLVYGKWQIIVWCEWESWCDSWSVNRFLVIIIMYSILRRPLYTPLTRRRFKKLVTRTKALLHNNYNWDNLFSFSASTRVKCRFNFFIYFWSDIIHLKLHLYSNLD
jgi:hypothetical protein